MYLAYFGLDEPPFRITPDTKFLFFTHQYEAAVDSLRYAIQKQMGFAVMTGEVGTGKTTLTRYLLSTLGDEIETALLINPLLSVPELLQTINRDFGIPGRVLSPQRLIQSLNKYLLDLHAKGRTALVVIDEAQNLSVEALEMIRMLSNLETEQHKLLQIVLVGQPELERKLASHALRQFRQRIAVHVVLKPLSLLEIVRYIHHRLVLAGGKEKVYFDPKSYRLIYRLTSGYPRLINLLCDRTLMAAYAADSKIVTPQLLRRARADLRMEAVVPPVWQFWRRFPWGGAFKERSVCR
ncbi:MAG: AAA family ATPase [Deltaproteobacteria bacterium]|nr:AAA family ATPase [Deltaproteobacteria bacterium]